MYSDISSPPGMTDMAPPFNHDFTSHTFLHRFLFQQRFGCCTSNEVIDTTIPSPVVEKEAEAEASTTVADEAEEKEGSYLNCCGAF